MDTLRFILLLFLILIYEGGSAQYHPLDSLAQQGPGALMMISRNLDSLPGSWIAGETVKTATLGISSLPVPSDQEFTTRMAGIKTPFGMEMNETLRASIKLYITDKPAASSIMLGLGTAYNPGLEKVLRRMELPADLKYLPMALSSYFPGARSPQGAAGFWQFMFTVAKANGLRIDSWVDERYNNKKATQAALDYIKDLYSIYKDWNLSVAAFINGPSSISKAMRRAGGKTSYTELYPWLPFETRDYFPAFIALIYIQNFHELSGINPVIIKNLREPDTLLVNKPLHFEQLAAVLALPVKCFQELNPQYKLNFIPAWDHNYFIVLPEGYRERFIQLSDSIYHYKESIYVKNTSVETPSQSPSMKQGKREKSVNQDQGGTSSGYYIVKKGETLGNIASKLNVTVDDLKRWNKIKGTVVKTGRKLIINKGQK